MMPWTFVLLRHRWRKAQHLHALEHATGEPLTIDCDAAGHLPGVDEYEDWFDKDQRRKYLDAIGADW